MASHTAGAERGLQRFEAFTDAVFAIALTLLIVELKAPGSIDGPPEPQGLAAALREDWRQYVGLGVSFSVIGIYWLQHHYTGRIYRRTDHVFSLFNLIFLFGVTFVAFPIRVWADHLGEPLDENVAATFLAWALVVPSVAWCLKWIYAAPGRRLMDERLDDAFLRRLTVQYLGSTALMIGAAVISLFAPTTGVALSLLVTAAYVLPPPSIRYKPGQEPDREQIEADG